MRSPENSTLERERKRRGFRLCFYATAALEEGRSLEVAGCVGGQQQVEAKRNGATRVCCVRWSREEEERRDASLF